MKVSPPTTPPQPTSNPPKTECQYTPDRNKPSNKQLCQNEHGNLNGWGTLEHTSLGQDKIEKVLVANGNFTNTQIMEGITYLYSKNPENSESNKQIISISKGEFYTHKNGHPSYSNMLHGDNCTLIQYKSATQLGYQKFLPQGIEDHSEKVVTEGKFNEHNLIHGRIIIFDKNNDIVCILTRKPTEIKSPKRNLKTVADIKIAFFLNELGIKKIITGIAKNHKIQWNTQRTIESEESKTQREIIANKLIAIEEEQKETELRKK